MFQLDSLLSILLCTRFTACCTASAILIVKLFKVHILFSFLIYLCFCNTPFIRQTSCHSFWNIIICLNVSVLALKTAILSGYISKCQEKFYYLYRHKLWYMEKDTFAPVVMLIDASYLDKVGSDMSAHFAPIVNRELPKADLANLLECLALDAGIQLGKWGTGDFYLRCRRRKNEFLHSLQIWEKNSMM